MLSNTLPLPIELYVAEHRGSHRTGLVPGESVQAGGADWRLALEADALGGGCFDCRLTAKVTDGAAQEVAAGIRITDTEWTTENYVLVPGAVYAGNRFEVVRHEYPPPMTGPRPGEDRRTLQTIDLPGLRKTGPSHLDQMSIDAAVPALAIYFPARGKALVLLTAQACAAGPFNYEIIENAARDRAEILLAAPGIRHDRYFSVKYHGPTGYAQPSEDRTMNLNQGESIAFDFRLHWVDCDSIAALHAHLFAHRKDCFDDPPLKKEIPYSEVFSIIERKQNHTNWREAWSLYQTSILGDDEPPSPILLFQSGWCGGVIVNYPLLQDGGATSGERVRRNLDFVFGGVAESGLLVPLFDGTQWVGDNYLTEPDPAKAFTLTRRVGDVLYFLIRQLMLLRERGHGDWIRDDWEAKLQRMADALVAIWERYGDFGQYIEVRSGELVVAGSTSGALIPGALVLAAEYFDTPAYLAVARAAATFYRDHDLADGLTTGGPGDAMQAPDSESVVALLESFMALHAATGEDAWLAAAQNTACQAAGWALSYDYRFPEGTALAEIGAQTRGAWIANAQNKTGVPGICTLSGQGFLRLYRAGGDWRWLEFLREVSHSMPQYMGLADKRISCSYSGGNDQHDAQPEGWICERINITQWGEPIGELFAYTTWCEVAMLLVCVDLPGVYAEPDSGRIIDLDHIEAAWADAERTRLRLHNPTKFPARVRILIEDAAARARPLAVNAAAQWPVAEVPAGGTVAWEV